ncbi:MAG: NTP transferase domain-containing protein [candidate division WS1 bacterium]|nr:NTP transferase domain-containing protein [candidate division WS1 bacterium]
MKSMCAVIPAAGKGTRLHPLTYAVPKELLPLGACPTIQHVVHELAATGIGEIIVVTSDGKEALQQHFDVLLEHNHLNVSLRYVIQDRQRGLGDAVRTAREAVAERAFAVALGDAVIVGSSPGELLSRMSGLFERYSADAVVAVQQVKPADTSRYGIVAPAQTTDEGVRLAGLVEKPGPEHAPSNLAICGRYLFKPDVFDYLERLQPGAGGELQLTDALEALVQDGGVVWACPLEAPERRLDVGTVDSYYQAVRDMLEIEKQGRP